jgi:alpha-beta hydrolase superfamily lysophospholipase
MPDRFSSLIAPLLVALALCCASLGAAAKPEDFRQYVLWFYPPGIPKAPLAILIEGSGGTGANAKSPWVDWFRARGVAVAQVRSAASRGQRDWSGTGCGLVYNMDARDVLDLAKAEQPRIDTTRFVLMGFSRGGTEVLNSARSFRGAPAQPAAVFALYPGCDGWCQTDYAKDGATPVHILYGDADEWGKQRDSYGQCRKLAGGKIAFHPLPGAHHGFDGTSTGTFRAAGSTFRYEPNPAALEAARDIVGRQLAASWNLPN